MRLLRLVSDDLEDAVAGVLRQLDAGVRRGPKGEHDLEVTFPSPFVRELGNGLVTRLTVNKRIVVEVKSSQKEGAKLADLRQLHDWVLRESRRIIPQELQDGYLSTLEDAKLDTRFRRRGDQLPRSVGEVDDADEAVADLIEAVDRALTGLVYRVKGILIINHHAALSDQERNRPFLEKNALEYALRNHLAVMSWQHLVEIGEKVQEGSLDPLNVWCPLFEADGVFERAAYNWREKAGFQHMLFDPHEVSVVTDAKFLKAEPESILGI
jgi:hypothetical protein